MNARSNDQNLLPVTDTSAVCSANPPSPPRRLNLALQGGGAHGAFTWGVLEGLLEDEELAVEGLSGSSAGAMNAVVFADGWRKGGAAGAREGLATLWTEVGKQLPDAMVVHGGERSISLSPASKMMASWAGMLSPTQLNPLGTDPLRDILERLVDFEGLRRNSPFKLFVGATQVATGKLRVFRESEISADVLVASACLPKIHQPVEIDGQAYWDGGYSANPAVFPLFYECESADFLLVLLSPLMRKELPRSVQEIDDRISEMSFNATFMREMQTFARATVFAEQSTETRGGLEARLGRARFHMIDASGVEEMYRHETKQLAHGPVLETLREAGRGRARGWLLESARDVGARGTVDLAKWFA